MRHHVLQEHGVLPLPVVGPVVKAFQQRPLVNVYPFIIVDAIYTKALKNGAVRHKASVDELLLKSSRFTVIIMTKAGEAL